MGEERRARPPALVLLAAVVVLLVCWYQAWRYITGDGRATPTPWQPPRPFMLPQLAALCDSSPSPSPPLVRELEESVRVLKARLAAAERAPPPPPLASLLHSTSEERLKRLWRLPPGPPGSRQALVEVHNASWAFLSARQLARGVSTLGDPLRLRCLAAKLLSGQPIKLSVVGGSVSFGTTFTTSKSKALFHWKVYQWLAATFPHARHEHYCGAVPASGPSYMEHCLHWHVHEPDLVLVEYAVNFDVNAYAADAQSFERMLRKLQQMRRRPAVIIVNTMELFPPSRHARMSFEGSKPFLDGYSEGPAQPPDLTFEYAAPAEDAIAALAAYYAVPTVSLRGALFRELKSNCSRFPLKRVFHDRHHPGAWGHSLMAQLVVEQIRTALLAELDAAPELYVSGGGGGKGGGEGLPRCREAMEEAPALGRALLSTADEAEVGMCVKDRELMDHVVRAKGFRFVVEGRDAKMKPGLVGMQPADEVELCVDVSRLRHAQPFVLILGHLISYEHMGAARLECRAQCGCEAQLIDAHVPGGHFSVFKARTVAVHANLTARRGEGLAANCSCVVQLTILPQSGSGEHKFKVLSLMTAAAEGSLRYGHQTGFNVRPTEARLLDEYTLR